MDFSTKRLQGFIDKLARVEVAGNVCNMYSYDLPENEVRRQNLMLYLLQMLERNPEVLLVSEAPGYQGTKLTGVPFCSEHTLVNGVVEIEMFGVSRGYQKTKEYQKVWKEPSGSIVWQALTTVKQLPLIWASFPFHPHKLGNPLSNRTPTTKELKVGEQFLLELIEIFEIEKIIAVGNKGEQTSKNLGYQVNKIRHPAHGGKNEFIAGLTKYLS